MNPPQLTSLGDLRQFLVETTPTVPVWQFLPALVATGLLCYLLALFYRRYGQSISNRHAFSRNFPVIGMTTMLIIAIVKSSLALSLGLVGALSIVRFRTAIKEPEELAYLFLTIAIGLGFGANQWLITTTAFVFMLAALWIRTRFSALEATSNLYLTVRSSGADGAGLGDLTRALSSHCSDLDLKRFDELDGQLEVSYRVSFASFEQLEQAKRALTASNDSVRVSFVDSDGIL